MSVDYPAILIAEYPSAQWTLDGDEYDGLTWLSDTPKPSKTELDALWDEVRLASQRRKVEQVRQQAYALSADSLFFQYQRGDATEAEWLAAVQAVKDAHPYPS